MLRTDFLCEDIQCLNTLRHAGQKARPKGTTIAVMKVEAYTSLGLLQIVIPKAPHKGLS
jgi:hypothetical protein